MSIRALLGRVVPKIKDSFYEEILPCDDGRNRFEVEEVDGKIALRGDCDLSLAMALGRYLKDVLNVDLSWCGNRDVEVCKIKLGFPKISEVVEQKYRVYLNYCTLCYSMSWWDWARWEKEIDFMALNGINMPLAVVGTEAVWFETYKQFGFSDEEALATVSSHAFWAWQSMSNIDGYQPPQDKDYIERRLALGKKIIDRERELGMFPIQQGFSGHVPTLLAEKRPEARIEKKARWCDFPQTAQLDPLDPLFAEVGRAYLENQKRLLGAYGFYAADPFHEGAPPKKGARYLKAVGRAIDALFKDFDSNSVWVMQSWSIRKHIAKAVAKDRLLILDIDGKKQSKCSYFWGYEFVTGRLHNFGGKNSLHGDMKDAAKNRFAYLKKRGKRVVGTGLFPEGIEQNPAYYALCFDMGTASSEIDLEKWTENYCLRRYGEAGEVAKAFRSLYESCYGAEKYEQECGSVTCARPSLMPAMAAPNDKIEQLYDNGEIVKFVRILLENAENCPKDGFQFDLCDFTRQALSSLITENQKKIKALFESRDAEVFRCAANAQLEAMRDLDELVSHRSELCLARWINDAHRLASDERERRYFDRSARMLITVWGDFDGDATLFDYAWREWSGLISEFYIPRWEKFYDYAENLLKKGENLEKPKSYYFGRPRSFATELDKRVFEWERLWVDTYCEYPEPCDSDVVPSVKRVLEKYFG